MEGKFGRFKAPHHPHTNMYAYAFAAVSGLHGGCVVSDDAFIQFSRCSMTCCPGWQGQGCTEYDDTDLWRGPGFPARPSVHDLGKGVWAVYYGNALRCMRCHSLPVRCILAESLCESGTAVQCDVGASNLA